MKKQLKNKWIKALESGEYEQTSDDLITNTAEGGTAFCCLGVLCDIQGFDRDERRSLFTVPAELSDLPDGELDGILYEDHVDGAEIRDGKVMVNISGAFPSFMQKDLGLDRKVTVRGQKKSLMDKLVEMNDEGVPFEKIAAYLRKINL